MLFSSWGELPLEEGGREFGPKLVFFRGCMWTFAQVTKASQRMARHTTVWQGISLYGKASKYMARYPTSFPSWAYVNILHRSLRHPDAWQGISLYGKASQCLARHLNIWQSISMYTAAILFWLTKILAMGLPYLPDMGILALLDYPIPKTPYDSLIHVTRINPVQTPILLSFRVLFVVSEWLLVGILLLKNNKLDDGFTVDWSTSTSTLHASSLLVRAVCNVTEKLMAWHN